MPVINAKHAERSENRRFFRWVKKNYPDWQDTYHYALSLFLSSLGSSDFEWREIDFKGAKLKADELWFERTVGDDLVDSICIKLDPDSRLSFYIYASRRKNDPEYPEFVRKCSLVRKRSDSYYGSKLHGARWWFPFKQTIFKRAVKHAIGRLPDLIGYLETGSGSRYVWESDVR